MLASPDDAEIDVVLNMLAGESSDSAHAEPMAVTVGQEVNKTMDTRKPEGIVAEPPGLFQLKCPSRTVKGSNTLKSE